MAMRNVQYPVVGKYLEDEATQSVSYADGMVIGKAIKIDTKIDAPFAELYGDGGIAERRGGFVSGALTANIDDLGPENAKYLLGRTATTEVIDGVTVNVIVGKGNDIPPFVGFGCYGPRTKNNIDTFRAIWLPKVQFGPPNETLETQEKQVKWQTPVLEGLIMKDLYGQWIHDAFCPNETVLKKWLNARAGIGGAVIDKTILDALIDSYSDLVETDYTSSTWSIFATSLSTAETVSANSSATQQQVFDAVSAIVAGYKQLEAA